MPTPPTRTATGVFPGVSQQPSVRVPLEKVGEIINEVKEVSDFLDRVIKACERSEGGIGSVSSFISHPLRNNLALFIHRIKECSRAHRCDFDELDKLNIKIDIDITKLCSIFKIIRREEKRVIVLDKEAIKKGARLSASTSEARSITDLRPDVFPVDSLRSFHGSFSSLIIKEEQILENEAKLRKLLKLIYDKISQMIGLAREIVRIKDEELEGLKSAITRHNVAHYEKLQEKLRKLAEAVEGLNKEAITLTRIVIYVKKTVDEIVKDRKGMVVEYNFLKGKYEQLNKIFNEGRLSASTSAFNA